MNGLIRKNLKGSKVLFLFILANVVYAVMLTLTIPKVMSYSGGMKLLDMIPGGYNAAYVNALLNALGEKGRDAYLFKQIPLDMIYPFLFGISGCMVLAWFLDKTVKSKSHLFNLCLLPLFAALFDYLENIGIVKMLIKYPNNSDALSQVTSVFTVLKSILTTAYFSSLIIIVIAFFWKRIGGK